MDILRNLLYQKINFENIYKTYLNDGLSEVAVSAENEKIDVDGTKFITIVADEYYPILKKLFYVEGPLEDLEDYELVSVEKESIDSYEVNYSGDALCVKCIHPYRIKNNTIRIIKRLNKKYSVDNSLIIIFREKGLSGIENRIIDNKLHKVRKVNDLKEMKDILIKFNSYYNERMFIENKLIQKDKQILETNLIEDSFRIAIAMDFINILSSNELQEDKINEFLHRIDLMAKLEYEKIAKKMITDYLQPNNFTDNYLTVDKLLSSIDSVKKSLDDYLMNNFQTRLREIANMQGKSKRYISLMDSGILKIDAFLSDEIKKLSKALSSSALEE